MHRSELSTLTPHRNTWARPTLYPASAASIYAFPSFFVSVGMDLVNLISSSVFSSLLTAHRAIWVTCMSVGWIGRRRTKLKMVRGKRSLVLLLWGRIWTLKRIYFLEWDETLGIPFCCWQARALYTSRDIGCWLGSTKSSWLCRHMNSCVDSECGHPAAKFMVEEVFCLKYCLVTRSRIRVLRSRRWKPARA